MQCPVELSHLNVVNLLLSRLIYSSCALHVLGLQWSMGLAVIKNAGTFTHYYKGSFFCIYILSIFYYSMEFLVFIIQYCWITVAFPANAIYSKSADSRLHCQVYYTYIHPVLISICFQFLCICSFDCERIKVTCGINIAIVYLSLLESLCW